MSGEADGGQKSQSPLEEVLMQSPPSNKPLARYWHVLAWAALASILLSFHMAAVWDIALHKQVFREGGHSFVDLGGTEADTHIDRLKSLRALENCDSDFNDCLILLLEAGDRHHPPVMGVSAALWNRVVGEGVFESIHINLLWLILMILSMYSMGHQLSGPVAAWLAVLMTVAAPIFLGPSRVLHQDMPMTAFSIAFGAVLLRFAQRPHLIWALLSVVFATLTVLTKWESVLGLAGIGAGCALYALQGRWGILRAGATAIVSASFVPVIWEYLDNVYSRSFIARPALWWFESPSRLREVVDEVLLLSTSATTTELAGQGKSPDQVLERIVFYLGGMPATSVGLLLSVVLALGVILMAFSPKRRGTLLLVLPWTGLTVFVVLLLIHGFADDRFVHLFLAPLILAGSVGLALIPGRIVLPLVAIISFLQVWDMSISPSPLPYKTLISFEPMGGYELEGREIALRPDIAKGHGVWVRPQQRYDSDLQSVRAALALIEQMDAPRLLLSPTCQGLCGETNLWHMAVLEHKPPSKLMVAPQYGDLHRPDNISNRCGCLAPGEMQSFFVEGGLLIADYSPGLDLDDFPWDKATCGAISHPRELGLQAQSLYDLPSKSGSMWIIALTALTSEEKHPIDGQILEITPQSSSSEAP